MTTYSTQFARLTLPANAVTTLFTVPANNVVVIRDVELFISSTNDLFNLQVGVPGSTTIVWYVNNAPPGTWHQWAGRTVVPAGEEIVAYSALGAAQLVVSGYLLTS